MRNADLFDEAEEMFRAGFKYMAVETYFKAVFGRDITAREWEDVRSVIFMAAYLARAE